jgi:DNA replication protein DnaC
MISKTQVTALAAGDGWLGKGANLLLFGPPGGGKSHLAAALGLALIENGWRVLFTRTTDLVQKLQVARRELNLEAAINRPTGNCGLSEVFVTSVTAERNSSPLPAVPST